MYGMLHKGKNQDESQNQNFNTQYSGFDTITFLWLLLWNALLFDKSWSTITYTSDKIILRKKWKNQKIETLNNLFAGV